MNRNEQLIRIRPVLPEQKDAALDSEMAGFQLATLRPILKLQHEFFAHLFGLKFLPLHADWANYPDYRKVQLITNWLAKDVEIKKWMEGAVMGMMTQQELDFYFKNEKEVQKRMRAFVIERLRSNG